MLKGTKIIILLAAALLLAIGRLPAQISSTGGAKGFIYPVVVSARFSPSLAAPGDTVRLEVTAVIDPKYHVFAIDLKGVGPRPTRIVLPEGAPLEEIPNREWIEPTPEDKYDAGFETVVQLHTGKTIFTREYKIRSTAPVGRTEVEVTFNHQACDETSCLPPKRLVASAPLEVRAAPGGATPVPTVAPTPAPATPAPTPVARVEAPAKPPPAPTPVTMNAGDEASVLAKGGTLRLFGFAIGFGLLTLLTPCVFPMIPITVSFFTKRAAKTRGAAIKLAFVYAGAIVLGFSLFGFGLALALRFLGAGADKAGLIAKIATNAWVNAALAGVFVAFALSLFGLFEIGLPSSWANALSKRQGGRTDAIGAVLMAMVFVVVSFTCTGPLVGPLIVLTLQGGWLNPFVGLLGYSIGFAAPFFVLALVPQALSSLPKSGGWLNATKVVMGFVELAAALKFLSNVDLVLRWEVLPRELFLAAWGAIAIATAIYLLGFISLPHDTKVESIGAMRLMSSLLFGTFGLYMMFGMMGGKLNDQVESLLPPYGAATATHVGGAVELEWIENDLERALAEARRLDRPVFVDFTGWTCTNCRLMEKGMFPRPEIRTRLEKFVRVRLYTDDERVGEKYQTLQNTRFETFSLPFYVLLTPRDETVATFSGLTNDEGKFREFLDKALR